MIFLPVALLLLFSTIRGIPKTVKEFKSSQKYLSNKQIDYEQRKTIVEELKDSNKKGSFSEEKYKRLVLVSGDDGEFVVQLKNLKTDYNKDETFSPKFENFNLLNRK